MPYTPTAWANDVPPPLSAANLNRLTDEIRAQAAVVGVANTLPTWVNGASPALTDAAPLNEIERVVKAIAADLGLSYTETVWSSGWSPARNATRLLNIENAVQAARAAMDSSGPSVYPTAAPITVSGPQTVEGFNYTSTTTQPCIFINTNQPVVIRNCAVTNLLRGTGSWALIEAAWGCGANVTIENVRAEGAPLVWSGSSPPVQFSSIGPRFISFENLVQSLTVRNCTIMNTRGIDVSLSSNISMRVEKCRFINPTGGRHGELPWGNAVQVRHVQGTSANPVVIQWNEILQEPGKAYPEDTISVYHSSYIHVLDNMLKHQSMPGNFYNTSSQGGITLDASDGGTPVLANNLVQRNQLVDGYGITTWPNTPGSNNNQVLDNRIVADRLMPDGVTNKGNGWGFPIGALAAGTNNHFHGNYINFIDRDGWRGTDYSGSVGDVLYLFRFCPEGAAAEAALNTIITSGTPNEAAEWTFWQNKLAASGITIGAS